ncbi:MAG: hypothetical protein IJD70_03400 [Clostridia bacterium]|nr:hypothetical protein [Clostridia bacterium]
MSTNIKPGNRRLLEAVEYIDEGMILDALSVLRLPKEECAEPIQTWKTPFKHWKKFTALAACLILLSTASPLTRYISQVVSNFRAGAGSESIETTEERLESVETTEYKTEIEEFDVEIDFKSVPIQLTENEIKEIIYAKIKKYENERYLTYSYSVRCFGKFDDVYAVYVDSSNEMDLNIETIDIVNGIKFSYLAGTCLSIYKDGKFYLLPEAFDKGIIDANSLQQLYDTFISNYQYTFKDYDKIKTLK